MSLSLTLLTASLLAAPGQDPEWRVAVPNFQAVNVTAEEGSFYSEHFAQQMALAGGLKVTAAQQIQTLLGLERQKEMLGCADDQSSCIQELANALGSEVVVAGSIGKFGTTFQINVKALSPVTTEVLALVSGSAESERGTLDELSRLARRLAADLKVVMRKKHQDRAHQERLRADEQRRAEEAERRKSQDRAHQDRLRADEQRREEEAERRKSQQSAVPTPPSGTSPVALPPERSSPPPVAPSASRYSLPLVIGGAAVGVLGLALLGTEYPLVGLVGVAAGGGMIYLGVRKKPEPRSAPQGLQATLAIGPGSLVLQGSF